MKFLDSLLNLIFPVKCISCGISGEDLCRKCLLDRRMAERECAEWIFPIYDYRDPIVKKSLWLFKYKNKKGLAKIFAEAIYEKILEELSELSLMENFKNIILIPVPLSTKRYRERGYNQAELICEELVKINKLRAGPLMQVEKNILIKNKETEHQAQIKDRSTRLKNLSGSFSIKYSGDKESPKNRNVIIIDDIVTTGATLSEAKKVLKNSGARKVVAFTVAH